MLLTQTDKYRRMRFTYPAAFFIFSLYGFFRYWNKKLAKLVGGAAAYLILFNIYYHLVAGKVYSFRL